MVGGSELAGVRSHQVLDYLVPNLPLNPEPYTLHPTPYIRHALVGVRGHQALDCLLTLAQSLTLPGCVSRIHVMDFAKQTYLINMFRKIHTYIFRKIHRIFRKIHRMGF